jgi:DNA repair protein RadA/Sms
MSAIERTSHSCRECGTVHAQWAGRCAGCGAWNSLDAGDAAHPARPSSSERGGPCRIADVGGVTGAPTSTGDVEIDRVLGGGVVPGSVTLLGGEPGIGKSTLLLQLLATWPGVALYVTAEESAQQVRARADRLGSLRPDLWIHAETEVPTVLDAIGRVEPTLVVVDSIQTVQDPASDSLPGSVSQVKACAQRFVDVAKSKGIAVVLVGHVTKDGGLAGPRLLEHLVDTVVQFEGDRHHALRMLRALKHRFGSTNELGLFEMTHDGLVPVADPSQLFLADRRPSVPGSVVVPTIEGRRPIVVEVQSLTSPGFPNVPPRRSAIGLDAARLSMLIAVLARRCGVALGQFDVFVSTAGGARLSEPGIDLGICLSLVSALTDTAVADGVVAFGEVGLGGEVRQAAQPARRLAEAARLGFTRAIVPANTVTDVTAGRSGIDVVRVGTVADALDASALT